MSKIATFELRAGNGRVLAGQKANEKGRASEALRRAIRFNEVAIYID
jgi:hypothetical protein